MKKTHLIVISALIATLFPAASFAAKRGDLRIGGGLTTIAPISGVAPSVLFQLNDSHSIQGLFGISSTVGDFGFDFGGIYRYQMMGDRDAGFHIGGLLLLGNGGTASASSVLSSFGSTTSTSSFQFSFGGVAGLGFSVADDVRMTLDAGPRIMIASSNASFSMNGAYSTGFFGASIHYLF